MSCKPFLKWVGGKTSLLPEIVKRLPQKFDAYYEPFLGGGALYCHLDLTGKNVVLNDSNAELINCWWVVRYDVEKLIEELNSHYYKNTKEDFLTVRDWDRIEDWKDLFTDLERAARFIFLNKTCFNGLYRVNNKGEFNTPYGYYKNPKICDWDTLRKVSSKLENDRASIYKGDYFKFLPSNKNAFVYLDPPYDVLNSTSNFTQYSAQKFDQNDQIQLSQRCKNLSNKGVKFLLSNSDTPLINELYSDFIIEKVQCKRSINCKGEKRGKINEVLIRNYE